MPKPKRKQTRKRAPKKKPDADMKLNADMTYVAANMLIPDDGPLASFNAYYEIMNGRLSAPDADAHEASREKESALAGMIGYVVLPSEQFSLRKTFPAPIDTKEIYARCAEAVRALPSRTLLEEGGGHGEIGLPTTIGVMTLWQKPDGTFWTVFYHHPGVKPTLAAALLKDVIDDYEKDDDAAPAGSGGASN